MTKIMAVNAGSSSLKFQLFEMPEETVITSGIVERIGMDDGIFTIKYNGEKKTTTCPIPDHQVAVEMLLKALVDEGVVTELKEIDAVGHRIVHGGEYFSDSAVVDDDVVAKVEELCELAPLHNPAHLIGYRAFKAELPNVQHVFTFDTAFHQSLDKERYLYPLPLEYYTDLKVRRYGAHGTSHKYVSEQVIDMLGNPTESRVIVCHLGNGASISAVLNGKCIDTSMGFTPNAGIMMGTRSGDIDYTMLSYVMKKTGYNLDKLDSMLNRESGLEAIAGMSDLRDLDRAYEANEEKVLLAFDMYTEKIVEYIAKYYVKLDGKVDAICFTAGGGENDTIIRGETLKKLTSLGIILDEEKNNQTIVRKGVEGVITSPESKIPVYVVATDEELMIARDTYSLTQG